MSTPIAGDFFNKNIPFFCTVNYGLHMLKKIRFFFKIIYNVGTYFWIVLYNYLFCNLIMAHR